MFGRGLVFELEWLKAWDADSFVLLHRRVGESPSVVQHSIDVLRFELCGLGDPLHEGDIARVPSKVLHGLTGLRPKTPPHGLFELTILAAELMVMVALAGLVFF